jgi:4-alpha-glucanotransferase
VIPLQDAMKLDSVARMNVPSRSGGNWQWRYTRDLITEEIIGRLRELSRLYGRCAQIKTATRKSRSTGRT